MIEKTLSSLALEVIRNYSQLPFGEQNISCPYFNNRRSKIRGALRVLIGKGNPQEIVDEAQLFALREKVNIKELSSENLKQFLVNHNLGIDCSAFAYYILEAEYKNKKKGTLSSKLSFPRAGFIRKLLIKLRPVENINVDVLSDENNATPIALQDVLPGDIITMQKSGKEHNLNHVLVIYKVAYEDTIPKMLYYCHSFQWSTDGRYNHGIKSGKIEVSDLSKDILSQKWRENDKTGAQNETFLRAQEAESLFLKRLKV